MDYFWFKMDILGTKYFIALLNTSFAKNRHHFVLCIKIAFITQNDTLYYIHNTLHFDAWILSCVVAFVSLHSCLECLLPPPFYSHKLYCTNQGSLTWNTYLLCSNTKYIIEVHSYVNVWKFDFWSWTLSLIVYSSYIFEGIEICVWWP